MYKIALPIAIYISKNKNFSLNLNTYRNTHYMTLNKAKVNFSEQVKSELVALPKFTKVELFYTLYPKTKRDIDIANVCTIVDKFFCDALVMYNKLEDDCYRFVTKVTYEFGSIDKLNPRVEVIIKEVKEND